MSNYKEYLGEHRVPVKCHKYYASWVQQFACFCRDGVADPWNPESLQHYLNQLSCRVPPWQLKQSEEAIQHYMYWRQQTQSTAQILVPAKAVANISELLKKATDIMRIRHYAYNTESCYLMWIKRFIDCTKKENGWEPHDIVQFLTGLAVERDVAKSTQNQALNALVFFFRSVIEVDAGDLSQTMRAKKQVRLPVVFTQDEILRIFTCMSGVELLMVKLIYGGGLRSGECHRLRIKDVDVERCCLTVRSGKGDKDRETLLSASMIRQLQRHMENVYALYQRDRSQHLPGVYMPQALRRKYPNASREWIWYWLFPAMDLSTDPRTDIVQRHHQHHCNLQRAYKVGKEKACIQKYATLHSFRHYAEYRIMPSKQPICT